MNIWFAGADRAWVRRAVIEAGGPLSLLQSFDEINMKIWLAGAESKGYQEPLAAVSPHSLQSFLFLRDRIKMIDPSQFTFFLDSGAYSAWSRGSEIDIDEFCAFIRANIEQIEVYACLDHIPGQPGRAATEKERAYAADKTWENYLYMKSEGLDPLPVYHYGEHFKYLERMLEYGCDYIGIGGLVSVPGPMRRHWLDRLFKRITDAAGLPLVKTHGFGMTAVPLIFRYPWYSIDSTTWIQITANGAVYLPALVNDEFVFDRVPATVTVSLRNPKQAAGGKAANTMSPNMRKILDRWLAICGKTYEEVQSHYFHRAVVNVTFFKMVSEAKAVQPFKPDGIRKQSIW